jgi:biopolymer transport protein ExbD
MSEKHPNDKFMKKNTFLIRFIDIGLILLFGFIIISDITIKTQIDLPGSEEAVETEVKEMTLIVIEVSKNGQFRVIDAESEQLYGRVSTNESLSELLFGLRNRLQAAGREVVAIIELDEAISMQQLVDVLDICDDIGIPKNINVPSLRL